ncbi:MAG: dehydratase [Chloroflexi bacterium]|nr:dehydratase [Chloroflexota bacterium]
MSHAWDEIQVGDEMKPLEWQPSSQQLVKWAGASGDYHQIHYDKDYALAQGLPGTIVHGPLKTAMLGEYARQWAGPGAWVRRVSASYRGMDQPGEQLVVRGRVARKYEEHGERLIDCEVWVAKGDQKTTTGETTVVLGRVPDAAASA